MIYKLRLKMKKEGVPFYILVVYTDLVSLKMSELHTIDLHIPISSYGRDLAMILKNVQDKNKNSVTE